MLETEKGKRMEQVLATGVTREELAEALWCAERSVAMWSECAEARVARMRELENDAVEHYFETVELRNENAKLRELAAEAIRLMQADGPDCGICKHYDECWTGEAMDYSPSGCVICNEARELGIEV